METKEQFLARYYAAAEAGASKAELQAMIDGYQAAQPVEDPKKKKRNFSLGASFGGGFYGFFFRVGDSSSAGRGRQWSFGFYASNI